MYFAHALTIFILAIGVALGVVFIASRSSKSSGGTGADNGRWPQIKDSPSSDSLTDKHLKQVIFEAISTVSDSDQRARKAANTVSDIFTIELEKKAALSKQELHKQYNAIIEQKDQSEKAAWEKYGKVVSDKKETEAVIRSIAEGLVVVDAKGSVIMLNPTAEKLLGISQQDKIGKSILDNIKKEQLISLSANTPEGEEREIEIVGQEDETKKILRSSSAVIENEDGQTVGMVVVLSDVTKQKDLDRVKSDFVSKVSHELRTPIITIQNAVTLLLGGSLGAITEKQDDLLNIAKRSLDRLALLINDLLDMSKLEASKAELKIAPYSIEKLINDACDTLNAWVMTKSLKIEKTIQKGIPEIDLDYNKMIQVLNNVIGNAIKFTPRQGTITIEAVLNNDKKSVLINVFDTGGGIPEKDLKKIFDKFYQAGERTLTDVSGTGLGLAIAKEIISLHKGEIWAENLDGRGAKISFILPVKNR